MQLDCLLVARDPQVRRALSPLLSTLSIEPKACGSADDALAALRTVKYDSVIVDCVDIENGGKLLRDMRHNTANVKTIAVALLPNNAGREWVQLPAHFLLEKPISYDMAARTMRLARDLMLQDKRRYFRHRVEFKATLIMGKDQLEVAGTNISSGGMAVQSPIALQTSTQCRVDFTLPNLQMPLSAAGEIVWANAENAA